MHDMVNLRFIVSIVFFHMDVCRMEGGYLRICVVTLNVDQQINTSPELELCILVQASEHAVINCTTIIAHLSSILL